MRDKILRDCLLGTHMPDLKPLTGATVTWQFAAQSEEDEAVSVTVNSTQGLIHYLLKRITKLEAKVAEQEETKKAPCKEERKKK